MDRSRVAGSRPEIEVVLMVVSENPTETVEQAIALKSIGGFGLQPRGRRRIHDVYFDTVEGLLRRRRMNLRLREVEDDRFITLKRSPGLFSWRRDERQEMELPWSRDSLARVFSELRSVGVQGRVMFKDAKPLETMKNAGLVVLQDRETDRTLSDVSAPDGSGGVLAELAVDSVVYHFQSGEVHLFELEVEARSEQGKRSLEATREALLEKLGPSVRAWRWGKLATGRMIERLLERGGLVGLLEGGRLRPVGYDRVEEALVAGRP